MNAGFVNLIGGDDEIFPKDRNVDGCSYGVQVRQTAFEASFFGEAGNDSGTIGFVLPGEFGRFGDPRQASFGWTCPFDFGDHSHTGS